MKEKQVFLVWTNYLKCCNFFSMSDGGSGGLLPALHVVRLRHVSHLAMVCEIAHDNLCRGFRNRTTATYREIYCLQRSFAEVFI